MGRKNRTEDITWEDIKILIGGLKRVLESDLGNEIEDLDEYVEE